MKLFLSCRDRLAQPLEWLGPRSTAVVGLILVASVLSLGAFGCVGNGNNGGGGEVVQEVPTPSGVARDESATLVTIDSNYDVSPNPVHVSKSAGGTIQWYNTSGATVTVTPPGSALGMSLPNGTYSYVFQVNSATVVGSYSYGTDPASTSGPTDPPQVDVDG